MNIMYATLSLSFLLSIAVPLMGADQDLNITLFNGKPPFCAQHIAEADATELDVDAEKFKELHTHALASIKTRVDDLQLQTTISGAIPQEHLTRAYNAATAAHALIASLAVKYGTNPARVSTQDILRCAQCAKSLENDDNYIDLTFHNGVVWKISGRALVRNNIGGILAEHEWIERSKYTPGVIQSTTTISSSNALEVKDADLDNGEWQWGKELEPNPEVAAIYRAKGPQIGITTLPGFNFDNNDDTSSSNQ